MNAPLLLENGSLLLDVEWQLLEAGAQRHGRENTNAIAIGFRVD